MEVSTTSLTFARDFSDGGVVGNIKRVQRAFHIFRVGTPTGHSTSRWLLVKSLYHMAMVHLSRRKCFFTSIQTQAKHNHHKNEADDKRGRLSMSPFWFNQSEREKLHFPSVLKIQESS